MRLGDRVFTSFGVGTVVGLSGQESVSVLLDSTSGVQQSNLQPTFATVRPDMVVPLHGLHVATEYGPGTIVEARPPEALHQHGPVTIKLRQHIGVEHQATHMYTLARRVHMVDWPRLNAMLKHECGGEWVWERSCGGYVLRCTALHQFCHGYFTRIFGRELPESLVAHLGASGSATDDSEPSVHRLHLVHSATVLRASQAPSVPPRPKADGLVSDAEKQSLWVAGADCTPSLLADPVTGTVAACHTGWRPTAGNILANAVQMMCARGAEPANIIAALGPAVSGRHYQVGRHDVSNKVCETVGRSIEAGRRRLLETGAIVEQSEDKDLLDTRLVSRLQLLDLGLRRENVFICPYCTFEDADLFHSYRREQQRPVKSQWSGIVSRSDSRPHDHDLEGV